MALRPLRADDRPQFAEFRCAAPGEPWLLEVQRAVRDELADALRTGTVKGIGLWDDDEELRGIVTWFEPPPFPSIWQVSIVAVQLSARRQGCGRRLMTALGGRAAAAGVTRLVSEVEPANRSAIAFHQALGGRCDLDPGDPGRPDEPKRVLCVIPVARLAELADPSE